MPATSAQYDLPLTYNTDIGSGSATGTINRGDWVAWSGHFLFATNAAHSAYWKASGAGVAVDSNPTYDNYGRIVTASSLRYIRHGIILVSGNFSGEPGYGVGLYPDATGSGVAAPTGNTGVAATWQTGQKLAISGVGSAGSGVGGSGVAQVVGYLNRGAAASGTGQIYAMLLPPRPDFF